jgi:hypothetical protein
MFFVLSLKNKLLAIDKTSFQTDKLPLLSFQLAISNRILTQEEERVWKDLDLMMKELEES